MATLLPGPYFFTPTRTLTGQQQPSQSISNTTVDSSKEPIYRLETPPTIRQNSDVFHRRFCSFKVLGSCHSYNGPEFCTTCNEPLFLWKWNASTCTNGSSHILSCAATKTRLTSFVSTKVKFRRHKCPCSYSNSMATFHLPLVRDLVYKLNPGPVDNATRNPGETNNEQSHKRITGKTSNNIIFYT